MSLFILYKNDKKNNKKNNDKNIYSNNSISIFIQVFLVSKRKLLYVKDTTNKK